MFVMMFNYIIVALHEQPCAGKETADIPHCFARFMVPGGPDVGDYVMSSADKTMYENTLNIALSKNVLLYVCLTLF